MITIAGMVFDSAPTPSAPPSLGKDKHDAAIYELLPGVPISIPKGCRIGFTEGAWYLEMGNRRIRVWDTRSLPDAASVVGT
jgi:hypothetical protein